MLTAENVASALTTSVIMMRSPEDVFEDFKGRRKGILRALTTE